MAKHDIEQTPLIKAVKTAAAVVTAFGVVIGATYGVLGLTFVTKAEARAEYAPKDAIAEIKASQRETRDEMREMRKEILQAIKGK